MKPCELCHIHALHGAEADGACFVYAIQTEQSVLGRCEFQVVEVSFGAEKAMGTLQAFCPTSASLRSGFSTSFV